MAFNPFADSAERVQSVRDQEGLDLARVVESESGTQHQVIVEVVTRLGDNEVELSGVPMPAFALTQSEGDISQPSEGDFVVIGYLRSDQAVVLGYTYTRFTSPPQYDVGDRRVSNDEDSHVTVEEDGTIVVDAEGTTVEVETNGDVTIDGGGTKPITNVTANTSTDADGHVTNVSLDITRADGVFVPSE